MRESLSLASICSMILNIIKMVRCKQVPAKLCTFIIPSQAAIPSVELNIVKICRYYESFHLDLYRSGHFDFLDAHWCASTPAAFTTFATSRRYDLSSAQ